jgi:hypothetical protein
MPKPLWSQFVQAYLDYESFDSAAVKRMIGGGINQPWVTNTCAVRMSRGLNYSNLPVPANFKGVQPAWLQLSRDRKPLKWREKAHVLGVEPRPVACSRGHYSPVGLKGDAQGTYPDR